jgi:hypothetical protein
VPPRLVAATAAVVLLLLPLAACAGSRTVTVTGWGAGGNDLDEARARAIADALGRAVQEAGRTAVASETRVVNDWHVSSETALDTLGVIRGYRVLDEGPDVAGGYRVRLVAQVAAPATNARPAGRILVIAREQYRGTYTPRQQLAAEVARALRARGFTTVMGEWRAPLVRVKNGAVSVSGDHARLAAHEHDVDRVLVVWAEARPGDTANATLHFARALGTVVIVDGPTGKVLSTKTVADVVDAGSTPPKAADAVLAKLRPGLALQSAVLAAAASHR